MRKSTLSIFLLALGALTVGVFEVEYRTRTLRAELHHLNQQILTRQEEVHVLKAEWSYLNRPERLKELADKHLQMDYVSFDQIKSPTHVPLRALARDEKNLTVAEAQTRMR